MIADVQAQRRQASRERQRARRQSLTIEERNELNAHRRANRQALTTAQRQQENTNRRTRRQRIPEEERQGLRAQRNANDAARRNTPCAQSIALPRPDAVANPEARSHASPVQATSPTASPSMGTTTYTIGTDSNAPIFTPLCFITY